MDCGFTNGERWFRYRACGIIIENECILFAKNDLDSYYYSIGGGVKLGETAEDAVCREVFEETGINYKIDRLAFIHENFFKGDGSLNGLTCHEIALYFIMKPRGTQKLNSNSFILGVREHMHWLPIKDLKSYVAYPSFFANKLDTLCENTEIEHIVTHE